MSSNQGVLFLGKVNGESEWLKNDDEDTDGKYLGEIRNGVPEGQGTFTFSDGGKYEGEWKDGNEHGQGTYTSPDGIKWPCPEKRDNELRVASEFIKELTFGLLRSFP